MDNITKNARLLYKKLSIVTDCCESIEFTPGGIIRDQHTGIVHTTIPPDFRIRTAASNANISENSRPYTGDNLEALLLKIWDSEHDDAELFKPSAADAEVKSS